MLPHIRLILKTHVIHGYKAGKGAFLFTIGKLMSGSSLEGKAFFKKPQTLNSKAFYFRSCSLVAVNFVFLKTTNKNFTYI